VRVLVTGATGFIGRHLCAWLMDRNYMVRAVVREPSPPAAALPTAVEQVRIDDIRAMTSAERWRAHLKGVDRIVHLAGLAHALRPGDDTAGPTYRAVNEDATRILSRAAARYGVGRFILVSTVKVFGEETHDQPFSERDPPRPQGAYAISKLNAEQAMAEETSGGGCEAVTVRPPLVYGKGVRGNFPRLVKLIRSGVPLPFGAIRNRRSIVSIWNLCDLLEHALTRPDIADRLLLPTDDRPVSTPELLRLMAVSMHTGARLLNVPPSLLDTVGRMLGDRGDMSRLTGSLEIDNAETRAALRWTPPLRVEDGLRRTLAEMG
jgi:nucleoside-diphosphate-sugar epimerase